jgi:single-stranded-DNA-specific exonuclease
LAELDAPLAERPAQPRARGRAICDRRGRGVAATITGLLAGGEPVLVLCADAPTRLRHMEGRLGGFSLCSHAALERMPELAQPFRHVVALDPPAGAHQSLLARAGRECEFTHLAWGEPELRFAAHIHEQEYGLRAALAELYRVLRDQGGAEGEGLEAALRGEGSQARSPALAGRLLRVLTELALVELDRERAAASVVPGRRTDLAQSSAYLAYQRRLEDGRQFLERNAARAA